MRAGKRRHLSRRESLAARLREARDAREAIARMAELVRQENAPPPLALAPVDFAELSRRYPGISGLAATLSIDGVPYTLESACASGLVYIRGDGRIVVGPEKVGVASVIYVKEKGRRG